MPSPMILQTGTPMLAALSEALAGGLLLEVPLGQLPRRL
jgi:hypothetical protein